MCSVNFEKKIFVNPPQPYWIASTDITNYPALEEDITADVAIIGGGMAGIVTAWLLVEKGLRVVIIDADRIISGTSGHTTAKITSQHALIYDNIKTKLGEEMAKQYVEANETAIKIISDLVEKNNIDCDFQRTDAYVYTQEDKYVEKILREIEAASSLGIEAEYRDKIDLPIEIKVAECFRNQAQFHPRKFLLALADKFVERGGQIFENTRAVDVQEGSKAVVLTENGKKVTAENVILASHYPFYDKPGLYFTRLYPERSYILCIKIKDSYPGGMYISAEDPGRSLRSVPSGEGELILVGGEHHKTGHGDNMAKHYENLLQFADRVFEVEDVLYRWSAQDYTTADEIPYAGRLTSKTPNIYVATGFRKWGMTNSVAAARVISDLITTGNSSWHDVYNPSRFTPAASAKNFIVENADVAKQLITGKLAPVPEDIELEPGEGKIVEIRSEKAGAFRDENGQLHLVDTTCTHLGCELVWNSAERTWDCPCHGSRFSYEGDIVEGPAVKIIKLSRRQE